MALLLNPILARAAEICLKQEERRLQRLAKECREILEDHDMVAEDYQAMAPGATYGAFVADYLLRRLRNYPWEFKESCYKAMEEKQKERRFLRWKASQNKAHDPLVCRKAKTYGLCIFWDGHKERFFFHEDKIIFATTKGTYETYNKVDFYRHGKSIECKLFFVKNENGPLGYVPQWEREASN